MPALYAPGDEYLTIDLPPGWDDPIDTFILARFKEFEQDFQGAQFFDAQFEKMATFLKARNEGPVWPRQVGSVIGLLGEQALEEALGGQILIP